MPPHELPDDGWLRLHPAGGNSLLVHAGTGEHLLLEGDWELSFVDGFGVLTQASRAAMPQQRAWASSRLSNRLMASPRQGYLTSQLLIYDKVSKQSVWRETAITRDSATRAVKLGLGALSMVTEVFISKIPRGGNSVRWSLPRVVDWLLGDHHDGAWLCRFVPRLRAAVQKLGFFGDAVRSSSKSVVSVAQKRCSAVDAESLDTSDAVYTVGTAELVATACHVALQGQFGTTSKNSFNAAKALIDMVVCKFVEPGPFVVEARCRMGVARLCVQNGKVRLLPTSPPSPLARPLGNEEMCVGHMVLYLASISRQPFRFRSASPARAALVALVSHIASLVEYQRFSDKFHEVDHIDVPLLRRAGSRRPRQLSNAFKLQASQESAKQPSLRNAQQFIAAMNIRAGQRLSKGRRSTTAGARAPILLPKAGRNFGQTGMLLYNAACMRYFGRRRPSVHACPTRCLAPSLTPSTDEQTRGVGCRPWEWVHGAKSIVELFRGTRTSSWMARPSRSAIFSCIASRPWATSRAGFLRRFPALTKLTLLYNE